jgi:hypothetical protein
MGSYRVVDIGTSAVAQLMIGVLEPASYVSYNLLAILCCACIFPLTLTRSSAPEVPKTPSLRPIRAAMTSPLGVAGVMVAGVSSSSLRMVGPIYGQEIGLSQKDIGYFLATVLIGGALAQFPVGYFADKYDRRWVLIWISMLSITVCAALSLYGSSTQTTIFALAFAFGFTTFPIYSVSTSHANDFATPRRPHGTERLPVVLLCDRRDSQPRSRSMDHRKLRFGCPVHLYRDGACLSGGVRHLPDVGTADLGSQGALQLYAAHLVLHLAIDEAADDRRGLSSPPTARTKRKTHLALLTDLRYMSASNNRRQYPWHEF